MYIKTGIALALVVSMVTGCAHEAPLLPSADFAPVFPLDPPKQSNLTGAIYEEQLSDNFFGRKRNYKVGDIITVVLNEATNATRNQNTATSRATVNTAFPSIQEGISKGLKGLGAGFLGLGSAVKQVKADANSISSDGTEKAGQYQSLTGSIAVTIVEVFSNGNLAVRGEKKLALNEGLEVIQVSGIIRIEDIAPDGTVQSRRLSNAQIAYRGSGEGADAARASWGTRALYKYWPF